MFWKLKRCINNPNGRLLHLCKLTESQEQNEQSGHRAVVRDEHHWCARGFESGALPVCGGWAVSQIHTWGVALQNAFTVCKSGCRVGDLLPKASCIILRAHTSKSKSEMLLGSAFVLSDY